MTEREYNAINWQNHNGQHLSTEDLTEIRRRLAGLHFSQEVFEEDPIAKQLFYIASALNRELLLKEKEDLINKSGVDSVTSSVDDRFLFSVPEILSEISKRAEIAITIGALASRLVRIERTRTIHPDGRAENVSEHSNMLSKVAPELAYLLHPELDTNLIASYASLHDDLEAYVGDTPTDMLSNASLDAKEENERLALQQLLKDFSHMPRYVELIKQYELQSTPEARFVRAVDKLMVLLIHIPNEGAVLHEHYTASTYLEAEKQLLARDDHKYGEFDSIRQLRTEISAYLANTFLE